MKASLLCGMLFLPGLGTIFAQDLLECTKTPHDQTFPDLATTWDEGVPLGNSIVGSLVWQKGEKLRFSLDRIDLWDLRPVPFINDSVFKFKKVEQYAKEGNLNAINEKLDAPYYGFPGPSKIPGAALEFDSTSLGNVVSTHLYLNNAVCEVTWESGAKLQTYVHSTLPVGYFIFDGVDESFVPELIPPSYRDPEDMKHNRGLASLGYAEGKVTRTANSITYHQPGWGDFYYDTAIQWKRQGKKLYGVWSITSSLVKEDAKDIVADAMKKNPAALFESHAAWWKKFWGKSSITLPDPVLEKQYYNEIYKIGSTARENSYPISLQSVWTADNGGLPPWKGDYHHDLNTQLSYWPVYTGNYLTEGLGYLNTLWNQRDTNKKYTKTYFETDGLNVPGVATLTGEPMGGWVQYSLAPTVSAWLAFHFYQHWQYSRDPVFLKERAYPYIKDVAIHIEQISRLENGVRQMPLSASPEFHDNSLRAWFKETTNYDLSLMKSLLGTAAELADTLTLKNEAKHWRTINGQLPDFDIEQSTQCLTIAPGEPYQSSHRHFSHAMAIHPLGLIDISNGEKDKKVVEGTIAALDKFGPGAWVGYSYSWLGNMKARAKDGEGAAVALKDFAQCFCLRNTFHVNGDQTKSGKSGFTYRPFTLEGNFAFASGIQEMLIQSHTGTVEIFPAIPQAWNDVSFKTLRTYGAFLVSATRKDGKTAHIEILSERGGKLRMGNPFGSNQFNVQGGKYNAENSILEFDTKPGQKITMTLKN